MIVGYFTLTFTIIPILAYVVNAESKEWTINGAEESCNRNETVIRAAGSHFSSVIVAACENLEDYSCDVKYAFAVAPYARINISKESPTNFSGILYISENGVTVLYTYMKVVHLTPRSILNFTIISPTENVLTLKTYSLCRGILATVQFVGCKNHTEFHVRLHKSRNARYLDEGTIVCTKSENGRAVFSNNSEALQTQCLDDATWRYAKIMTCIYPIAAELRIDGKPYTKTVDLNRNQSSNASNEAFVQCFRSDRIQDNSTSMLILHPRKREKNMNNSVINLHPNLNGGNISCYFESRYTTLFGPILSTSLLNISFGPYPPIGFTSLCYFNNGSIRFYSNPASTERMLSLWQGENTQIPATITECCELNYGVVGQLIAPNMSITGSGVRLRRNYSGRIEHFNVTPCPIASTTTTQVITTTLETYSDSTLTQHVDDTNSRDFTVVAILGIGIFVLMTFTLIIVFRLRRRNKEKSKFEDDKLENVNPLYEHSHFSTVVPKENGQVIRLYESTHTDKSGSDVYSVVDKKKGAQQSTESASSETVTYAVVDRSNKKDGDARKSTEAATSESATYAVVNRNTKKGSQKSNIPASSGAETYAVVDRNNKKATGAPKLTPSATTNNANYAVINRENKKAKGAQKAKKSTELASSHVAFVDWKNKKFDGAQKSTESASSEAATYASVDRTNKEAKGAQKSNTSTESTTSGVATAVMDITNKTVEGALISTGSTIPDVETYAVVDRHKKKATGVGYEDNRGPRKK